MARWVLAVAVAWLLLGRSDGSAAPGGPGTPGDLDVMAGALVGSLGAQEGQERPVSITGGGSRSEKSVVRAMLLSALVPGLGEIYAGGRRGQITGAALAATDVFAFWRYMANDRDGDDQRVVYEAFANEHYSGDTLYFYVKNTVAYWSGVDRLKYCRPPYYDDDSCETLLQREFPLGNEGSDDFYQQIGGDDRYVMGWDDWDPWVIPNHEVKWTGWTPGDPIPEGLPSTTENREEYLGMRQRADDYYGRADKYAWIMVVGRVVSMVDAAVLTKIRNRDLAAVGTNPRLSVRVMVFGRPSVKVGLKMRF
ncbi:MAG: hypothetical protein WAW06_00685 [bacterium]